MRIAILGSTGQIGSRLCKAISEALPNDEVLYCSRKQVPGYFLFDPFTDNWKLLGKVDILINAIGAIENTTAYPLQKVHIGLAEKILANYDLINRPKIIHLSALGAKPTHKTMFLKTKGVADEMLLKIPDIAVLRPSIVYTPNTMLVQKINMLLKISAFMGNMMLLPKKLAATSIQPIMAEDLNRIILKLIQKNAYSGIIELAGPEKYTLKQLIETVAKQQKRSIKIRIINDWVGDVLLGRVIACLFPKLISREQYILLKDELPMQNNQATAILGSPLKSLRSVIK